MKIGIYVRVSSEEQRKFNEERLNNVEYQINNDGVMNDAINIIINQLINIKSKELTNEEKRNVVINYIDSINVYWDEKNEKHLITIKYQLDNITFTGIESIIDINYKKKGSTFIQGSVDVRVSFVDDVKVGSVEDIKKPL